MNKLFVSVFTCLSVGILGSFFTNPNISSWYQYLNKPSFSPPNWLFAPVWTILYILMGISVSLIWQKKKPIKLFFIHLFLNFLWSVIFFGLRSPMFAFFEITILWILIFTLIKNYWKINKTASILLWPYLAWVSFASILNFAVWQLN